MTDWYPTSWRNKPAKQQPDYPDTTELWKIVAQMSTLPPLVSSWEVETLKEHLGKAARGEMFLLQGGDCAESFEDCEANAITSKLKILLQASLVLAHATHSRVILVGRVAGQYAKPRSGSTETIGDLTLPTYRGDLVNRSPFTLEDRTPDPKLLLRGFERAAITLNFIRSLADGGFADLHHPEYWNLSFVEHSPMADAFERIVGSIRESLDFMEAVAGVKLNDMRRIDFYTSHEGLILPYEQAHTCKVPHRKGWYNLSTHLPWIGMRTAECNGAHVEYFRGIKNPIGLKVGAEMSPEWLKELVEILHPDDEPGRLVLIHRFGADKIADKLPALIDCVQSTGKTVLWSADPMHGNTELTADGIKTRRFETILSELEQAFEIHASKGSILGGVHFELTGENVTECVGGARGLSEQELKLNYRSTVDPRLNYEQALEMAMLIARHLRH